MKALLIDCPTGISGDMLLSASLDLGVPLDYIESAIYSFDICRDIKLEIRNESSKGINGIRFNINHSERDYKAKSWKSIEKIILNSNLEKNLFNDVIAIYNLLAESEANVHEQSIENLHLHELGSIKTLINIVGFAAAIKYLKSENIYCSPIPLGLGHVNTSHGLLPVPVPVVLEILRRKPIKVLGGNNHPSGELTTPTGLALASHFVNYFEFPEIYSVQNIGIGLGNKKLDRPNFLRIIDIDIQKSKENSFICQNLVVQESFVDDASPEDIASLCEELRLSGALEVITYNIQMKKGRQGICMKVLSTLENSFKLRELWFKKGTTIGIREAEFRRWVLPRREGICKTSFGEVMIKEVFKADGFYSYKLEQKDLYRISQENNLSIEEVRRRILIELNNFRLESEWSI
tara:strand:+ start:3020 stop:4237 length:1218 start_codon:yes stop_codon:yes gene_type:complete